MKTDTPETDAAAKSSHHEKDGFVVRATFARQLERERDGLQRAYDAAIRQMNEAIARAEWLRTDAINELENERDALRAAMKKISVWKTFTQAEHDQVQITGYWLRKESAKESCVADLSNPATRDKTIRKLCKLMREGWVIGGIHFCTTQRVIRPEPLKNHENEIGK